VSGPVGTAYGWESRDVGGCVLFLDPFGKVCFVRVQTVASKSETANSGNRVYSALWKKDTANLGS